MLCIASHHLKNFVFLNLEVPVLGVFGGERVGLVWEDWWDGVFCLELLSGCGKLSTNICLLYDLSYTIVELGKWKYCHVYFKLIPLCCFFFTSDKHSCHTS